MCGILGAVKIEIGVVVELLVGHQSVCVSTCRTSRRCNFVPAADHQGLRLSTVINTLEAPEATPVVLSAMYPSERGLAHTQTSVNFCSAQFIKPRIPCHEPVLACPVVLDSAVDD